MALRNAGFSMTDSPRALISSENVLGSFTQAGMKPHRISANDRLPSTSRTTGTGSVGATLWRGGKSGCSVYANSARTAAAGEVMT